MIAFHNGQSTIAKDTHRFRVVCCGRRFGKTTLAIYEMIGKAVAKNNANVAYVAPTYQQARDIAWVELKKLTQPIIVKANESKLELILKNAKGGTSTISLRGWESVENYRGMHFDFLVLDEVASYRNFLEGWHEVLRPALTDTFGHCLFIGTPKGFNHFYDLYNEQSNNKDFQSHHYTTYDNPFISKEELETAKKEMTEDRFAQEYMGDFRKIEGLVYKEFDRTIHLEETYTGEQVTRITGIDFGYTNPAAIVTIIKDRDNCWHITNEWYKREQTTEHIAEVAKLQQANKYYPDPAEPDRIEVLKKNGINCMEVSKDVKAGIDCVRNLFKQNRLKISRECKNLITELESYRYDEKKPDKNAPEAPVKENDHALDALRYALYNHEMKSVSNTPKPTFFTDFQYV